MVVWLGLVALSAATVTPPAARTPEKPVALLPLQFELRDEPIGAGRELPSILAEEDGSDNPLVMSAFDDGRQRLQIGVRPGGAAKLGIAYRLSLGD